MSTGAKKVSLALMLAMGMAMTALGDTFVSSAFSLDMRLENGRRIARGTENIQACAAWKNGDIATVVRTSPEGNQETILTASGSCLQSVSWDAKHAGPGDYLFTHTISRGGTTLATYSVTFEVPAPTLEAIRIFGPTNFYSGNSAQYICMGYFSDDSGRELSPEWSIADGVPGVDVENNGIVSANQSQIAYAATLRAVATVAGTIQTNDFPVSFAAAHLSLGKKRLILERTAGEGSVSVSASGNWTAQSSDSWLVVSEGAGDGDGMLVVTCDRNPDLARRMATVTVTCGSLVQTIPVMQYPREPDDTVTVVFDAQGGSIAYAEREYVVGSTYGALPFPSLPGKVFGGWWTAVGGQGTHIIAGSEVTAAVKRLYAYWRDVSVSDVLNGALDWMSDYDEPWVVDKNESRDGQGSMRSGVLGGRGTSTIMTEVTGPGRIVFWWRTSSDEFDWLAFYDGNDPVSDISGETGWEHVEYAIRDTNRHVLRWSYEKWSGVGAGDDCAWLDEVVWLPDFASGESVGQGTDDHVAPVAWRALYGLGNGSLDIDSDGDGLTDWEEYVAGTNPMDPSSSLRISISMGAGTPVLSTIPFLGSSRQYIMEGKASLADPEWVSPTNSTHRFFRARMNLK